jgi:cyclic pyranopterin phosphate synthase
MQPETMKLILDKGLKKGDVLSIARLAGIMGAKKTPELIPLCHPLALSSVEMLLTCNKNDNSIEIISTCIVTGPTGVEMEALTAVSIAALTVYDMCKAVDRGMYIKNIHLTNKSGGKSGDWSEG